MRYDFRVSQNQGPCRSRKGPALTAWYRRKRGYPMFHVAVLDKAKTSLPILTKRLHSLCLSERIVPHAFVREEDLLDSYYYGDRYHALIVREARSKTATLTFEKDLRRFDKEVPIVLIMPSGRLSLEGYQIPLFRYYLRIPDAKELASLMESLIEYCLEMHPHYYMFNDGDGFHRLSLRDIQFFMAYNNRVRIHAGDKAYTLRESIFRIEEQLQGCSFLRIHRSFLVNIEHVHFITTGTVILRDGTKLPIGKKYNGSLRSSLRTMLGIDGQ